MQNAALQAVVTAYCLFAGIVVVKSAEVMDVAKFVEEKGWRAHLGPLCAEFELNTPETECIFRQISVQEIQSRGDPRAFNVPIRPGQTIPYFLIFHLGPLVGEFFIVSPEGHLLRAFYRVKGQGYERLPNGDVQEEFQVDVLYWIRNLERVKQGLDFESGQEK